MSALQFPILRPTIDLGAAQFNRLVGGRYASGNPALAYATGEYANRPIADGAGRVRVEHPSQLPAITQYLASAVEN